MKVQYAIQNGVTISFEAKPPGDILAALVYPNGYARPVNENYGLDVPPPLPKPVSQWRQATCSCGPHVCTACGKPYWIEIHGVADGHCTYCYCSG